MKVRLAAIPATVAGTDRTLKEIGRLIAEDLKTQRLRLYVSNILRSLPNKAYLSEARAIYRWVASHIRYQRDPIGVETVQSPYYTIRLGVGDCDDQAALVAAMALAVGMPARFRVVGYDLDNLVHIWPELLAEGRWWPADTTEPKRGFGWRPKQFPIERIYNFDGEVTNMAALPTHLPVTRGNFKEAIKAEVKSILASNWRQGLINDADLASYLRVIDESNFPTKEPLLVEPTRAAIQEFRSWAPSYLGRSTKPIGTLSGLEGLNGFLSSVWNGVKKVASAVVKVAAPIVGGAVAGPAGAAAGMAVGQVVSGGGGGGAAATAAPAIQITPTLSIPPGAVQTQVTPGAAQAGVTTFLSSPVGLIAAGALLLLAFRSFGGQRRG